MPPTALAEKLQCVACGGGAWTRASGDLLTCQACGRGYPRRHGVWNMLGDPSAEVLQELQGMMREQAGEGKPLAAFDEFVVVRLDHVPDWAELEAEIDARPTGRNYYRNNRLNLERALALAPPPGLRVLEIGAENPFDVLHWFRQHGAVECTGVNLHFRFDERGFPDWVDPLLADMNRLPFPAARFDAVVASATSHHSPDLDATVAEMSRVLAPGGLLYLLNDPGCGLLKHVWRRWRGGPRYRHALIHENEYSLWNYRRLLRHHGFGLRFSFFSAGYEHDLRAGRWRGMRWAPLVWLGGQAWRLPGMRRMLRGPLLPAAQLLFGLELNLIAQKLPL